MILHNRLKDMDAQLELTPLKVRPFGGQPLVWR